MVSIPSSPLRVMLVTAEHVHQCADWPNVRRRQYCFSSFVSVALNINLKYLLNYKENHATFIKITKG